MPSQAPDDHVCALHEPLERFVELYEHAADPWGFDTEWYQRRKFALTLAALPKRQYRLGLEPGCANGALTALLATRCDRVIAFDAVTAAVTRARTRLQDCLNVDVRWEVFPEYWPSRAGELRAGGIDLVVWSDIAYYLTAEGMAVAGEGLQRSLDLGGTLIAVHYTGPTNYPLRGSDIAPWLDGLDFLRRTSMLYDEHLELGVWERQSDVHHGN
jgi:hypothetical protein